MMDAGDGRNSINTEPQAGGYIDYLALCKSSFLPALFFVIGVIIGRLK
jgi:hypothetical protein